MLGKTTKFDSSLVLQNSDSKTRSPDPKKAEVEMSPEQRLLQRAALDPMHSNHPTVESDQSTLRIRCQSKRK